MSDVADPFVRRRLAAAVQELQKLDLQSGEDVHGEFEVDFDDAKLAKFAHGRHHPGPEHDLAPYQHLSAARQLRDHPVDRLRLAVKLRPSSGEGRGLRVRVGPG